MTTRRLFFALPVPESVRSVLRPLMQGGASLRWTSFAQLHVTLRFLGDVEDSLTERLLERLQPVKVEPFVVSVEGVGVFPPKGPPRTLWVGLGRGHPALHQLRQKVDDTALTLGVDMDVRRFHPHITIARCAQDGERDADAWLHRHREFAGPSFAIDAIDLFASELLPRGPVHTLVARLPLIGRSERRPPPVGS